MRHEDMDLVLYGVDSMFNFVEKYLENRLGSKEIPEAVIKYVDLEEDRNILTLKNIKFEKNDANNNIGKQKKNKSISNKEAISSPDQKSPNEFPQIAWWIVVWIYLAWALLNLKGYFKVAMHKLGIMKHSANEEYFKQKVNRLF
uniref:Uncharacterized protein n=1 Tax=Acrobeloides nanus TaxID=290746 RepID=A0A914D0G5_9BILA